MLYYATALLHLKLIEVKAKQMVQALTSAEKDMREAVIDFELNVPQLLYAYINAIGAYCDKMGKEMILLKVPDLPVTVVQGFGGYHAVAINAATHNLFEEIPSLGIAGDMVMALASPNAEPEPNFHIGKPNGTVFSSNLAGKFYPIGPRCPEIVQRLARYGITATTFAKLIPGTRFSLKYTLSLSNIIGRLETLRVEKIMFKNETMFGGESLIIKTKPSKTEDTANWYERNVKSISAVTSSTAQMGASYVFGFQLYKEDGPGKTRAQRVENWSCLVGTPETPFEMPDHWYNNRNDRRNMPGGINFERFRAISMRQNIVLMNVVRRMMNSW